MRITLPGVLNDWLHDLMEEYGFNKSELLEAMAYFVSMPENLEGFKSQWLLEDVDEDGDEEDDEDEEEDDEEEEEDDDEEE